MGNSEIIAVAILLLITFGVAVSVWTFVSVNFPKQTPEIYDPMNEKVAVPDSCKVSSDNEVIISIRNSRMKAVSSGPMADVPFEISKNLIPNPNFEKDENGDGVPDSWNITNVTADIVLATDLSNSMQRCMDNDANNATCPLDLSGLKPSDCVRELPCSSIPDCSSWTAGHEERYCVNSTKYFKTLYSKAGNGLAGSWSFEAVNFTNYTLDSSGYGLPGRLYGYSCNPAKCNLTAGLVGSALKFDGVNDYVEIKGLKLNTTADGKNTVTFWMRWSGQNNVMPFGWNTAYDLYFTGSCFGFNTGESNVLGISSSGFAGNWKHVAAVFYNGVPSSTKNELYINGVKRSLTNCLGSTTASKTVTSNANVSGWGVTSGYKFNGAIDELHIYNRSLNASEIQALYQKELGGTYAADCMYSTDGSCISPYPIKADVLPNVSAGGVPLLSCDAAHSYPYENILSNCGYAGGCSSSTACAGKTYSGNYTFGATANRSDSCSNYGECALGTYAYTGCTYVNKTSCATSCNSSYPYSAGTGPTYNAQRPSCLGSECAGGYYYPPENCTNLNRTSCGTPCNAAYPYNIGPGPTYNAQRPSCLGSECAGGYYYPPPVTLINQSSCGLRCDSSYPYYSYTTGYYTTSRYSSNCLGGECFIGNTYQNCLYVNRTDWLLSSCSDGLVDQGDRIESSIWRITPNTCLPGEKLEYKTNVTACVEGASCTGNYFYATEACTPGCSSFETCCGVTDNYKYLCSQYSDNCCERWNTCRLEEDYCAHEEWRNCAQKSDNCCSTRLLNCAQKSDNCCQTRLNQCQTRTYECCDQLTNCYEQDVRCCTENVACEQSARQQVVSCSPDGGYTNGPPDPLVNNCINTERCDSENECFYCNNVALRLAKKLGKNFTETMISKGNRIGLVSYGTQAQPPVAASSDVVTLTSVIDSYQANMQQTCVSCAINRSIAILKDSPHPKFIVLMSDGTANMMMNSTGGSQAYEAAASEEAIRIGCEAYTNHSIVIYTVGFGAGAGTGVLQSIADCTTGRFYQGIMPDELNSIYTNIAIDITGRIDSSTKKYGGNSMRVAGGLNYGAMSSYVELNPAYTYTFANYIKLNRTAGSFYVDIYLYDSNFVNIKNITLGNYSSSLDTFTKETYRFNLSDYPQTKYGQAVYLWSGAGTINGTAWVDDVFLGPAVACTGSDNSYSCGELNVTKISGYGDMYPFMSSDQVVAQDSIYMSDTNCLSETCGYLICSPDKCKVIFCKR